MKKFSLQEIESLKENLGTYKEVAKYLGITTRTLFNYRKNKSYIKRDLDNNNKFSLNSIENRLNK